MFSGCCLVDDLLITILFSVRLGYIRLLLIGNTDLLIIALCQQHQQDHLSPCRLVGNERTRQVQENLLLP